MTPIDLHMEWCPDGGDCDNPACGFRIDITSTVKAVIEAEREACALLVEHHWPTGRASDMDTIAAEIRARALNP